MSNDKKSILILDDDLTIRKLLSYHLKGNGYLTAEAASANEAFQVLNENQIDLVLCDVTMDEMDGFTFCRKVRENLNYRTLPFVFVTAKTSLEDKTNALDAGGDDFITKPFNIEELIIKVNTLIKRTDIYKAYGVKRNIQDSFSKSSYKLLLLDDDETITKLFHYNLVKEGYQCVVAHTVSEAMQILKRQKVDLIISDIIMQEQDGYEFRKLLLNDPALRAIPFVFLSSKSNENDILHGYDLEIADYVIKDNGPKIVIAKINAIIKNIEKEKNKIVNELNTAADSLRAKVVPDIPPDFEGFRICQLHKPYKGIPGGDFIDYFKLDDYNLAVVLGDVMGKKWSAWYFAFAYAGYVRSALRSVLQNYKEFSPSSILQEVNKYVYHDSKVSEVFATISVLIINNITRTVKYAGAGDLPVIFKTCSEPAEAVKSKGLLLGFAPEGNYKDHIFQLKESDMILMITDGIIESRSENGEQYGSARLMNFVNQLNNNSSPLEYLQQNLHTFTSGKFEDDVSAILIKAV